jgi:hypothetical protein
MQKTPQYDGTLLPGALAAQPGLIAGAFQFDGTAALVSTLFTLPPQGTITLWVKPHKIQATHGIIGTFGTDGGANRLWIVATGDDGGPGVGPNRLVVNLGDRGTNHLDIPSPFIIDSWTHLALTFDYLSHNYTLYVNGQVAQTATAELAVPRKPLDFGGIRSDFNQNFYWDGWLDEVFIFDHVLPLEDIQDLAMPVVPFTGFFPPLSNLPVLNVVQAGQSIPVKFSLGENRGLAIFAPGYPKSQSVPCDPDDPINDVQPTETAGGSGLTYDPTTDEYTYLWKTDRQWRKSCRQLLLRLTDGIDHKADFRFK